VAGALGHRRDRRDPADELPAGPPPPAAGGLEREPLAESFPVVAASFFGVAAVLLFVLNVSGVALLFDPGLVVAACLIRSYGRFGR
jgi:hypothetical protein